MDNDDGNKLENIKEGRSVKLRWEKSFNDVAKLTHLVFGLVTLRWVDFVIIETGIYFQE